MASVEDADVDNLVLDYAEEEDRDRGNNVVLPSLARITNPSVLEPEAVRERKQTDEERHARVRYPSESPEREPRAFSHADDGFIPRYRYRRSNSATDEPTGRSYVDERKILRAKRFGIAPPPDDLTITEDELEDLYASMGIHDNDPSVRLHSVFAHGVDNLSSFQIEKIFAEFSPSAVEMVDTANCNVVWTDRFVVGKMLLEMSKPLKRVRGWRESEEGEVAEGSGEEEGEMIEEEGDDVTICASKTSRDTSQASARKDSQHFVEVDVDHFSIPPGKWRVLTRHVEHNRLILLRFSTREDLASGRSDSSQTHLVRKPRSTVDQGFSYKWTNKRSRVRAGLNIFNEKGDELEWDYEHDTRFYENGGGEVAEKDAEGGNAAEGTAAKEPEEFVVGTATVKSRGRGAKKLRALDDILHGTGSMAADEEETKRSRRRPRGEPQWVRDEEESDDSDWSDHRDPSPTPQPWDAKRRNVHLRVTVANRNEQHH